MENFPEFVTEIFGTKQAARLRPSKTLQPQIANHFLGYKLGFHGLFLVGGDYHGRIVLAHRVYCTAVDRTAATVPAGGEEAGEVEPMGA